MTQRPAWYDQLIFFSAHTTMSQREMADRLHKSEDTVGRVLKRPEIAASIETEREKARREMSEKGDVRRARLIESAYKIYEDLVVQQDELNTRERREVALDILKGFGEFSEKRQVETTNTERRELLVAFLAILDDDTIPLRVRETVKGKLEAIADGDNPQ